MTKLKYYISLLLQITGELLLVALFFCAILLQRFYNYIGA